MCRGLPRGSRGWPRQAGTRGRTKDVYSGAVHLNTGRRLRGTTSWTSSELLKHVRGWWAEQDTRPPPHWVIEQADQLKIKVKACHLHNLGDPVIRIGCRNRSCVNLVDGGCGGQMANPGGLLQTLQQAGWEGRLLVHNRPLFVLDLSLIHI